MAIRDVFVHVDASKNNAARVSAAIELALQHDAMLTGIYVLSRPVIPAYAEAQISEEILAAQANALKENAERAHAAFLELAGSKGLSTAWKCIEGITDVVLYRESTSADILVVGQHDPDEEIFPGGRDMPDQVILSSGRPVLLIPYTYDGEGFGKRVMVAWDGSARASRAVHDALPILKSADSVTVMVANPEKEVRTGTEPGAKITAHLLRHGVKAEAVHITNPDVNAGELLLSRAADMSADMIVCGAYGHARWKEIILGGVTDHLLEHMPVPVLMSH